MRKENATKPPRHNCVSVIGLSPTDEGQQEFWINKDVIQHHYKRGPLHKFYELHLVKEVMAAPAVIFRGLEREGQEEAYCYAGLASCGYTNRGDRLPPPLGMTFAVYVTKDFLIFRWGWERSHEQTLTYPENYPNRYRSQLWPRT